MPKEMSVMAWFRPDGAGGWFYHRQDPATAKIEPAGGMPAGPVLADAALGVLLRAYRTHGDEPDWLARARDHLTRAIALGCADPVAHELWIYQEALGGRVADIEAAIAAADRAIALCPAQDAESAWTTIRLVRTQLAGRLGRMTVRTRVKDNGETEVIVPHHPGANAKRIRPLRFARR